MKKGVIFLSFLAILVVLSVVYHLWQKKSGVQNHISVLCMGDSLTQSSYGNYPAHLNKFFLKEGLKVLVHSAGRPGNTSGEYLYFLRNSDILLRTKPMIIIIMLGTNDVRIDSDHTKTADFINNLTRIIVITKGFANKNNLISQIFLATPPPIYQPDMNTFDHSSAARIREEILPAVKKISREQGLKIIDINSFFSKNQNLLQGIHPSKFGYYKMAEFIFKNVLPYL